MYPVFAIHNAQNNYIENEWNPDTIKQYETFFLNNQDTYNSTFNGTSFVANHLFGFSLNLHFNEIIRNKRIVFLSRTAVKEFIPEIASSFG